MYIHRAKHIINVHYRLQYFLKKEYKVGTYTTTSKNLKNPLLSEHFHLFAHSALVVLQLIFFLPESKKKRNKLKIVLVIKILCRHRTIVTQK